MSKKEIQDYAEFTKDLYVSMGKEILLLKEENENLRNHLDTVNEEIQILTGDLRATASALDDLEII